MRAWVLASLIAVLATPAVPQCNFSSVLSDPFRISILDLAADGNDLWAATSYGVSLYDRTVDPPRLESIVAVPGTTRIIRLGGGLGYAGSGNSIAVLKKNNRTLQLIRTIDAGAQVNDIAVTTLSLFVASSSGLFQYNANDLTAPPVQLTQNAATSLALNGSTLFAARGDSNVDVFSTSPVFQRTSTLVVNGNVNAVHVNDNFVYVSTALGTAVFVSQGSNAIGSSPFPITSLAPISGDIMFVGGTDRAVRVVDFSKADMPVELFRDDLPPSGGTINRVTSVAIAGNRAYVGGGDSGITEYDITSFSSPFPMRSIAFPTASSVFSLGDNFYAGRSAGVTEFSQGLVQKRSWDGGRADVVQDGAPGFLLTSSGNSASLWALNSLGAVGTATFASPVTSAAIVGQVVYAVLSDRSLWSADFTQSSTPPPQKVDTKGLQPVSIARSGNALAIADTRNDGTTAVALLGGGSSVSIPGLATSDLALSGTIASVQTFKGITLVDLMSGSTVVLPQSNDKIAREIVMSGTTLLELTDSTLRVWNTSSRTMTAEVTLPSAPVAVHIADGTTNADVVTQTGIATIALDRLLKMPYEIPSANGNAFYKKVVASANRIALSDARGVDLFTPSMEYAGSIRAGGIVDVAASDASVYTLSANLTITQYSPSGVQLGTVAISEGADAQALSITTVKGAVWASIQAGCSTGSCVKKTIVYTSNLSRTISLTGQIVDLVTSGTRAYALTDLPAEIRVINIADPANPSIVASTPGSAMSIAYSNGTIYVLGSGLAAYSEASLAKTADIFSSTSSPDEHIRIDGGCAVVTGRGTAAQLFTVPQFTAATAPTSPSAPRSLAAQPGSFYILGDNSLEIWSTSALPKPPRKHSAR